MWISGAITEFRVGSIVMWEKTSVSGCRLIHVNTIYLVIKSSVLWLSLSIQSMSSGSKWSENTPLNKLIKKWHCIFIISGNVWFDIFQILWVGWGGGWGGWGRGYELMQRSKVSGRRHLVGKDKLQVRGGGFGKISFSGVPLVPHASGTVIIGLLDVGNLVVQQSSGKHCMKSVLDIFHAVEGREHGEVFSEFCG